MAKHPNQRPRPHAITFENEHLTQQHQKDEVDINNIMARYVKTGVVDHINQNEGHYGDISPLSYHESMNIIENANTMFADLPAQARKNFDNDPQKFLEYVQNPANSENLTEMALNSTSFKERNNKPVDNPPVKTAKTKEPPEKPAPAASDPSSSD